MKLLAGLLHSQSEDEYKAELYRSLIHHEAKIGGELFGPIPKGTRREFFCLDEHTWVWHEEWADKTGRHAVTTRYDVRPSGVVKSQGTNSYQTLSAEEAKNLYQAVQLYYHRVSTELSRLRQQAVA